MKVNYDQLSEPYQNFRTPDKRIEAAIYKHTKDAKRIINVGAGTGAYEPSHCNVTAVEPSLEMIAKRQKSDTRLIQGFAENIPFNDNEFDIAMGILTIHHWNDISKGLGEMLRVARQKVILLTWVDDSPKFWLEDYFPEIRAIDKNIFPSLNRLEQLLGNISSEIIQIPADCSDGFLGTYWKRPQAYLNKDIRAAISTFSRIHNIDESLAQLKADIDSGEWNQKYSQLLNKQNLDLGYRLVICEKE